MSLSVSKQAAYTDLSYLTSQTIRGKFMRFKCLIHIHRMSYNRLIDKTADLYVNARSSRLPMATKLHVI